MNINVQHKYIYRGLSRSNKLNRKQFNKISHDISKSSVQINNETTRQYDLLQSN